MIVNTFFGVVTEFKPDDETSIVELKDESSGNITTTTAITKMLIANGIDKTNQKFKIEIVEDIEGNTKGIVTSL